VAQVLLTDDARDDLRRLDGGARRQVLKALRKLEDEPSAQGAPLGRRSGGDLTTFRKLVVGDQDYRVVYRVEADGNVVVVWVVGRRADGAVYGTAVARLRDRGDAVAEQVADAVDHLWREDH